MSPRPSIKQVEMLRPRPKPVALVAVQALVAMAMLALIILIGSFYGPTARSSSVMAPSLRPTTQAVGWKARHAPPLLRTSRVQPSSSLEVLPLTTSSPSALPALHLEAVTHAEGVVFTWSAPPFEQLQLLQSIDGKHFDPLEVLNDLPSGHSILLPGLDSLYASLGVSHMYYQLRSFKGDSNVTSNLLQVSLKALPGLKIKAEPSSPAHHVRVVYLGLAQRRLSLKVTDSLGRPRATRPLHANGSWQQMTLPTTNWPSGRYLLTLEDGLNVVGTSFFLP